MERNKLTGWLILFSSISLGVTIVFGAVTLLELALLIAGIYDPVRNDGVDPATIPVLKMRLIAITFVCVVAEIALSTALYLASRNERRADGPPQA